MVRIRPEYPVSTKTTAMLGIDWQHGFGSAQWTDCPEAPQALANWLRATEAWRSIGGTVINVYTEFTEDAPPQGNLVGRHQI